MREEDSMVVQKLQAIKSNLENRDIAKVYQLCDELKIIMDKYQISESIRPRIKTISEIAQPSTSSLTLNDRVMEIDALVDIMNAEK